MTISRATAQANADTIKNEIAPGANTATRVGQLFRDLSDSVAFTADLAAAVAAGITEAAVRVALAALTAAADFNGQKLSNIGAPAAGTDAATKTSSEAVVTAARVLAAAAAFASDLAINTHKITGVVAGVAGTDAVNLTQMQAGDVVMLRFSGSTTGNTTSARFLNIAGGAVAGTANTAATSLPSGKTGHITSLQFTLDTAQATGDLTITVQVNGVDSALVATLAHGSTSVTVTGSIAVNATDTVGVKTVSSAADATTNNPRAAVIVAP